MGLEEHHPPAISRHCRTGDGSISRPACRDTSRFRQKTPSLVDNRNFEEIGGEELAAHFQIASSITQSFEGKELEAQFVSATFKPIYKCRHDGVGKFGRSVGMNKEKKAVSSQAAMIDRSLRPAERRRGRMDKANR